MNIVRVLLIAALGISTAASVSHAASPARRLAAQRALERAVYAKGPEGMIKARAELEALSRAEPKSAVLHYWVALADWRLVPRLDDPKPASRFCKDGLDHADQALRLDPRMAEALALKAGLQGLSLRFDPSATMSLGMEIETHLHRALEMAPENPRVLFLDALSTLHKPSFVGGGADKALPKFEKAQQRFDAEAAADSASVNWGRFEAYVWGGKSAVQLGDFERARASYQKALAIDPENGWVRHTLLPELEKAAAAPAKPKDES